MGENPTTTTKCSLLSWQPNPWTKNTLNSVFLVFERANTPLGKRGKEKPTAVLSTLGLIFTLFVGSRLLSINWAPFNSHSSGSSAFQREKPKSPGRKSATLMLFSGSLFGVGGGNTWHINVKTFTEENFLWV